MTEEVLHVIVARWGRRNRPAPDLPVRGLQEVAGPKEVRRTSTEDDLSTDFTDPDPFQRREPPSITAMINEPRPRMISNPLKSKPDGPQ
jgi:hypothetical protein